MSLYNFSVIRKWPDVRSNIVLYPTQTWKFHLKSTYYSRRIREKKFHWTETRSECMKINSIEPQPDPNTTKQFPSTDNLTRTWKFHLKSFRNLTRNRQKKITLNHSPIRTRYNNFRHTQPDTNLKFPLEVNLQPNSNQRKKIQSSCNTIRNRDNNFPRYTIGPEPENSFEVNSQSEAIPKKKIPSNSNLIRMRQNNLSIQTRTWNFDWSQPDAEPRKKEKIHRTVTQSEQDTIISVTHNTAWTWKLHMRKNTTKPEPVTFLFFKFKALLWWGKSLPCLL